MSRLTSLPRPSWLLVALLLAAAPTLGQDLTTNPLNIGLPPNGVFDGFDFDSVQLNNGNLHIEIPLWSDKGRGLSPQFKYVFDNKGWYFVEHCDRISGYCTDVTKLVPGNDMQWVIANSLTVTFSEKFIAQTCGNGGASYLAYSYTIHESNGTTHSLQPNPEGQCNLWSPLGSPLYADDGSGWRLFINADGTTGYAINQSGIVFSAGMTKDTNGNEVTTTDTLGRSFSSTSYQDSSGNTQTIQVTNQTVSLQTQQCIFSGADACNEYTGVVNKPHLITLPGSNLTYTINYPSAASYGEPISVTLPTGGQISWTWANAQGGENVSTRTETVAGQSYLWTYGGGVTDPAGNVSLATCTIFRDTDSVNSPVCYITKMLYYQGAAVPANLIKTVVTDYAQASGHSTFFMPIRETTTWNQQGLTTKAETDWDTVSTIRAGIPMLIYVRNPIEKREFAYGSGSPGGLIRRTHYNYLHNTNSAYNTLNILAPPTSMVVSDGSGIVKAQTTYSYDGGSITSTAGTPAPNHDYPNFGSSYTTRGNLTQTGEGLLVNSTWTWLNTTKTYDDLGNVLTLIDPGLNQTASNYADNWADSNCTLGANTFAFLTKTTDPLSHQTTHSYFRCTGLVASAKDQNDINNSRAGTTFTYDFLNRPLIVNYPDGGRTTNSYTDSAPLTVTQQKLLSAGVNLQRASVFDGLGRLQQTQLSDPDCTGLVKADHAYGFTSGAGKFTQASTPYCNTPNSTFGLLSTTNYDGLERVTSVRQADGSTVTTAYSGSTAGLVSTVTDEAGKSRKSQTDALGNITAVWEDPNGLNYETDYSYDILNNLTQVTQASEVRTFSYDSLSRLLSATNPETGTILYSYVNSGNGLCSGNLSNPCTKTDARGLKTTYGYDALNRLTQKSYSDTTPAVTLYYDQNSAWGFSLKNTIGRLSQQVTNSTTAQRIFSYDPMGRLANQWECLPSNCGQSSYNTSMVYDFAGDLTQLNYPSGRSVGYTINSGGRVNKAALLNGQTPIYTYASGVKYSPNGALQSSTIGNNPSTALTETYNLNSRLQLASENIVSPVVYAMNHTYGFVAGQNNGNVPSIIDQLSSSRTQNFGYDSLNRLSTAVETSWGLGFGYDRYGNLLQQNVTLGTPPGFSTAANIKNQLVSYGYDAAGNMTSDGSHTYQYDAESRMKSLDGGSSVTYSYDSDGTRVAKHVGSDTAEYIVANGQSLSQHHSANWNDWSDLVYLNGKLLAKADTYEDRILITGTTAGSQWSVYYFSNPGNYAGYVMRSGDKLFLRQWQGAGSRGGMTISFTDGTNTNWGPTDQDGQTMNNDGTQQTWHYRRIDLSSFAGKTISQIYLNQETSTTASPWSIYYTDIALVSVDGSVRPLYNRQTSVSMAHSGVAPGTASVNHLSNQVQSGDTTTSFYHGDHLGSSRLMSSVNGYPIWQATYLPFGYEYNPQITVNRYKFTSKERDTESGFDYFGARHYGSNMGRFLQTDPKQFSIRTLANPQKWNKYAYVLNNPLALIDPNGMEEVTIQVNAFIQNNSVGGFRGDNRGFSSDMKTGAEHSRVSVTMRIETDPVKNHGSPLIGNPEVNVGTTHFDLTGSQKPSTGPKMPEVTATQDKNGNVNVNLQESMRNPFTPPGSGSINTNLNVRVNQAATRAGVNGSVSGSPSFEANFSVDGSASQNLPLQTEPSSTLGFMLGLQQTNSIDKEADLPPPDKKEDQQ